MEKEVHGKIGHSVAVILMNENSTPAEFRDNAIFILVYNRQKSFKKEPNGDFGELQYLKPKEKGFSTTGKSLVFLIIEQRYSQS